MVLSSWRKIEAVTSRTHALSLENLCWIWYQTLKNHLENHPRDKQPTPNNRLQNLVKWVWCSVMYYNQNAYLNKEKDLPSSYVKCILIFNIWISSSHCHSYLLLLPHSYHYKLHTFKHTLKSTVIILLLWQLLNFLFLQQYKFMFVVPAELLLAFLYTEKCPSFYLKVAWLP